jgi:hypothetical protein
MYLLSVDDRPSDKDGPELSWILDFTDIEFVGQMEKATGRDTAARKSEGN